MEGQGKSELVAELLSSGLKQGAEGLLEYLVECDPTERAATVAVIEWLEGQSASVNRDVVDFIATNLKS